jgi:selenocysteine lyase/cysteine desulfurase
MFWIRQGSGKDQTIQKNQGDNQDFAYLKPESYYFDSACQTLRPQVVIDAQDKYYKEFNSCGGRVKYPWGEKVETIVEECRNNLLKLVNKSSSEYAVAFGLNSTHLINLVLHQIKPDLFERIITTEIEHNSVFLPSMTWAKRYGKERTVLERKTSGEVVFEKELFEKAIFIANITSNIDGRKLINLPQIANKISDGGGLLLLDACQAFAHDLEILRNNDFDACFGSGHKMYAPSLGFVIFKKSLFKKMDFFMIGGSTVTDTRKDDYDLIDGADELYAALESGLQNYGAIIGLNEAIKWKRNLKKGGDDLGPCLFEKLQSIQGIEIINSLPSPVISLYSKKIDSHKLGQFLSQKGIMCRTGYHCCHYYLKHRMSLPPLLRVSLGANNALREVDHLIETINFIIKNW